jgi:predicted AlkP superfamily pyrophosphatase or phosphodiesterase
MNIPMILGLLLLSLLQVPSNPATAPAEKSRVLIISIDGLRPDLLIRADSPTLHGLLETSAYTFWAQTVPHAITLPAHVSMLTGVEPRKHEVEWNKDLPLREPVFPATPTLFELAHSAGYTTAMVAGKSKFDALARPGTLDWIWLPSTETCEDEDVTREAVRLILSNRPQVMFVHLPSVDNAGHRDGWGSPSQRVRVAGADRAIARIMEAMAKAGVRDRTTMIITSDHGGAGRTHVAGDSRALFVPWIIHGPGVRKDLDLTKYPERKVSVLDTFATACGILQIPLDNRTAGKVVSEAFESNEELLHNN